MKIVRLLLAGVALWTVPALFETDARACGGCLIAQNESTQVTGHRMVLSISNDRTTLWDQITYSGDPSSFAWVLPIKGTVDIGLSSDALFNALEGETRVDINSPVIMCPPVFCNASASSGAAGGGPGGGGVVVVAQEVVGPYETVQLSSQDPNALKNWLTTNGYNLPLDISPVVDAYVAEGFNFLALKLVPGQGINSMRPVRITSMGATPVLPLRMVAAGTGQTTPITLWIMGEGRYEAANFPNFEIKGQDLVWNWDTQSSNYAQLKDASFAASNGKAWLTEGAEPFSKFNVTNGLTYLAQFEPANSGYGTDAMGTGALNDCLADLDALWGAIPDQALWMTRLHGELSRAALGTDLNVQVSANQVSAERTFNLTKTMGTPPECPQAPPECSGPSSASGGGNGGNGGMGGAGGGSSPSCAMTSSSGMPTTLFVSGVALALAISRRNSRRQSSR
jgi:Uncharacterized protein conserved in bacteria (DUF2330)